jgi:hypothetical protein
MSAWAHFHRCVQMRRCGQPYDPPPLDLDTPDPCSWGGWGSVPWVSLGRYGGWEVRPTLYVRLVHLKAVRWTAFAQGCSGWSWNNGCDGWSGGEVHLLIQVITTSSIRLNCRFLDQSCSSKLCTRGRTWLGPGMWHDAGAAAPAGPAAQAGSVVPGGAAVPGLFVTLVPFPS